LVFIDCSVKEAQCGVVIFQCVIARPEAVKNPGELIFGVKFLRSLEVLYRFEVPARFQLRNTSAEEGLGIGWVNLDSLIEIVDGKLVISHVLVDLTSSDEKGLVLSRGLVKDLTKAN